MNTFLTNAKKPIVFMIVGGLGCFVAALLAELFLYLTSKNNPPQAVCLTLDVSGSMAGSKLDEIKEAAKKFIDMRKLSRDQVALTIFSSAGKVLLPFTRNKTELVQNIDALTSYGGTNFEAAMKESESVFENLRSGTGKSILLFTDGANSEGDPAVAVATAKTLRDKGIRVFAIATNEADFAYLAGLTGDAKRVIRASDGRFDAAFVEAEKMISNTLMQSNGGNQTRVEEFLIVTVLYAIKWQIGLD